METAAEHPGWAQAWCCGCTAMHRPPVCQMLLYLPNRVVVVVQGRHIPFLVSRQQTAQLQQHTTLCTGQHQQFGQQNSISSRRSTHQPPHRQNASLLDHIVS